MKHLRALSGVITLLTLSQLLMAQPQLVRDIPDNAKEFFSLNGTLYFFSGDELWKSEGTSGTTVLVKKLDEEVNYNSTTVLTLGNYFFFTTRVSYDNISIWRSDGTPGNTEKIIWGAYHQLLGIFQDKVIFLKNGELWQLDLLQQEMYIQTLDDNIDLFSATDDYMYFGTTDYTSTHDGRFALWVSDGTENGTYSILRDHYSYARNFQPFDNQMYMTQVQDLGEMADDLALATPEGITKIWTSSQRTLMDYTTIEYIAPLGDKLLLFVSPLFGMEYELWEYDPNTNKVTSIRAMIDTDWATYQEFITPVVINNTIAFNTGKKIFRSNGINTGTYPIADMYHGYDAEFTKVGDLLFYINHASANPTSYNEEFELYQSGLYPQNTSSVRKLFGNTSSYGHAANLTEAGGKLFFSLESNTGDKTLWIYDPTKPADGGGYFTVVNADTDQDIQWLKSGDTIVKPAGLNIALRFNPTGSPGSVQFWNGPHLARTENSAPFSFPGDNNGDYQPWTNANPGDYTFTAIPHSLPGGNGVAGPSTTVHFTIVTPAPKVPPIVSAGPDREITFPTDSTFLYGSANDPDGSIVQKQWRYISGTGDYEYDIYSPYSDTTKIGFHYGYPGIFYFTYTAIDNEGLFGADTVRVIVNDFPAKVAQFILVNADNNEDIRVLYNTTIDLSTLPPNLSIRAETIPTTIQKVVFDYDNGRMIRAENVPPYTLFGNDGGSYIPGLFTEGYHDLNAVPYLNDTAYRGKSIRLHVIRSIPGALNKFVLVRADTDQDLFDLTAHTTLYLDELPAQLNVRVETNTSAIGSVTFSLNNTNRAENVAPYSVFGDNGGNFNGGTFPVGDNYIEAKAYSGSNGTGAYINGIYVPFRVRASRNARLAADYYESGTQVSIAPNPSADRFAIRIEAAVNEHTSVEIFNANGLLISKLYDGPGQSMELQWDASNIPAGIYFCHARSNNVVKTYKLMVVR